MPIPRFGSTKGECKENPVAGHHLQNSSATHSFAHRLEIPLSQDRMANSLCQLWSQVPWGRDNVCAYVPCLTEMLARQGKLGSRERLIDSTQEARFYSDCSHEPNSRCQHIQLYEDIADALTSKTGPRAAQPHLLLKMNTIPVLREAL